MLKKVINSYYQQADNSKQPQLKFLFTLILISTHAVTIVLVVP